MIMIPGKIRRATKALSLIIGLALGAIAPVLAQHEPFNYDPVEQPQKYKIEMSAPDVPYVRWNRLYSRDSISVLQGGRLICKFAYADENPMIIELGPEVFQDGRPLHFQGKLHELVCHGRQYLRVADVPVSIPKRKHKLCVKLERHPVLNI